MAAVLVTGGAGYVGSHTVRELLDRGEKVFVIDDLSEGHAAAVSGTTLIEADLSQESTSSVLDDLLSSEKFDAVLHFGAKAYVGESVSDPGKYYRNNVGGGLRLLSSMVRHNVPALIFSSTCATYGRPQTTPIEESHAQQPINPYGRTKLIFEWLLADFEHAHKIRYANLRYFNAAGAHESGELGEDHRPETHLIPLACDAALGSGAELLIFGSDYETADGTGIRDYVHVQDLANAHVKVLGQLRSGSNSVSYNIGTGTGHSVLQVVDAVEKIIGRSVPREFTPRRQGDPARLVAASNKIRSELDWAPKFDKLQRIIETALTFKERHPNGFTEK